MQDTLATFTERFFNPGFFSTDLTFACCCIVLLGRLDTKRHISCRLADLMLILIADALLSLLRYLLLGTFGSLPAFCIILACYALVQHELRAADKMVRCSTFMASLILLTGITGLVVPVLTFLRDVPLGDSLPNVFSFATLLGISLFVRRYSVSGFRYVPRIYANLVVTTCAIAALSGLVFIRLSTNYQVDSLDSDAPALVSKIVADTSSVNLLVDVGFLVLVLIAYHMFYQLCEGHERRAEQLVSKRGESDSAGMIEVTRSVYETMREVRHEAKNHVAYMQAMLEAHDYDHLGEYFSSYLQDTSEFLNYVQTGNSSVDAIVNAKLALANSQGVSVKTMLAVPERIGFSESDLFTLIANLMDNAIEGALASEAKNPSVRFSIRPEGGYYIITAQNPCLHRQDASGRLEDLETTKDDKDVHGYGTKMISRIARRHKGTARYRVQGDVFTTTVMLAQEDTPSRGEL